MAQSESNQPSGPRDGASPALAAAILRISATLDFDALLREAIESARALTGAGAGVIVIVDEAGEPVDHLFSGLEPDKDQLLAWPDGLRLVEHLRGLPGSLRAADLAGYVRGLGMEPIPAFSRTFQATPMRHGTVDAGIFLLGDKADGREFSNNDEAVLSILATHVAAAVANARVYRAECRIRRDLDALIEMSPVGVVRFDTATGALLSLNPEACRLVESLRTPGHPTEQLIEVIVCRRADGSEWSFAEMPLPHRLATAATVRTEEVTLSVPDGRSVRALVNLTPVPAINDDGAGSVVVTLQDLTPLDEIDRMRADFLALVGHELRQPLVAIKGSVDTLLEVEEDLDLAEARGFHQIIAEQTDHMRSLVTNLLDAGRLDAGELLVRPEPVDIVTLIERARTTFAGGGTGHAVAVDLSAELPLVMADRRRVVQVLSNLLSNAARQSPESTPIEITAERSGTHVTVSVADHGRGIAPDRLPHLFRKHSGDGGTVGNGLGLAISKGLVEAHGGRIWATSDGPGLGATLSFTLPTAPNADERRRVKDAPDTAEGAVAKPRVVVVDDDPSILRFVRGALEAADFAPIVTQGAGRLADILRKEKPRLVLLDLMLPGADGIELMGTIPELADLPVIFISGYGRDETVARAFEAGAVDYLVKPFSKTELVARVRGALRRVEDPDSVRFGELEIDYGRRRASVGGREVELTATEFDLLRVLSLEAGRVVHSDTLLRRVWPGRETKGSNVVRTFVGSLRRKLGDDAAEPAWIVTERGVGYRMPRPQGQ